MMDTIGIGKRIQGLRKAKHMTQEQVAEILDISVNYLSNIETGRDICATVLYVGLANLLEASMDYILGDSLVYNKQSSVAGEQKKRLLHDVEKLSEEECTHILKYLLFLQDSAGN